MRRGKIVLIRRKYLAALALCAVVAGIFYIINHPALVGSSAGARIVPIYSVLREDKALSLTFNITEAEDQHTARVLDILNAHNVRATFFVTGDWVRENGELAAALTAGGHELMNLGDDHSILRRQGVADIYANIAACNDVLSGITGMRPTLFRAPYGEYDERLVSTAAAMGMQTVQWSIDSFDWRGRSAEEIARRVTGRAFPGGIVLLHSNLEQTALALPDMIAALRHEGYVLIPVGELVIESEFTISPTGRQIPN